MARKVLEGTQYTFTPSTRTITINEYVPRERLVLVTNVTANRVIYNFSDAQLKATSYTAEVDGNLSSTIIVLSFDTSSMSSSDQLMITIDEYADTFVPAETFRDPVDKLRVSNPQSLIDTDFEYGTQTTKWENLGMVNYRPFAYAKQAPVADVTDVSMPTNSRVVTITTSSAHGLEVGTAISVLDTYLSIANGNYIVESVTTSSPHTFTYTASSTNKTSITSVFDLNKTLVYSGGIYSNAQIGSDPTITYSGKEITVVTTVPHGLALGNEIAVTGTTADTNAPNGSFNVSTIVSATSFKYYVQNAPTGTIVTTGASVYVRPQSLFLHRPFDGGVVFTTNSLSNFQQSIRQTRRYFRYQSGKGMQISSGTVLKPNMQVDSITHDSGTVTVQTKESHNVSPGVEITVSGANETAYNGTFTVQSVINYNAFTYAITPPPVLPSPASGDYSIAISGWYGCKNRLGIFDDQNGMFFEFDGQNIWAVRRTSTFQLSGKVTATYGSNVITQTNAAFPTFLSRQLNIGEYIVIRGQSYRVVDIDSDTQLTISPSYRGATTNYAVVSKTTDIKWSQSEWNLDRMDGTGPSGYELDLTKMQMFYIDYTWYGAGYIRWGLRGSNGDVTYFHKIANNNVNNEAYMRSGNLPARYETNTIPMTTKLEETLLNTATTMTVTSTSEFPESGTIVVRDNNAYEYINYSSKTPTTFDGLTRARAGDNALPVTIAAGSSEGTVADISSLQVGMRIASPEFPENTFISELLAGGTPTIKFSKAALSSNPTVIVAPMGAPVAQTFTYSATNPIAVEYAFPDYSSYISHWGTAVIMDGRFDTDRSLLFTYGQETTTTINAGETASLFSVRLAPSVDNGVGAVFGAREIINRMQLITQELDVTLGSNTGNVLVTAVLNGIPSTNGTWFGASGSDGKIATSSLAQIVDYSQTPTTTEGGEKVAGFFVNSNSKTLSLTGLRDLGNSILGGGTSDTDSHVYPDGPDVLTINVTNLDDTESVDVLGRLTWTEAQA
jgi:hypothetical protein